jgi:urate oxidase
MAIRADTQNNRIYRFTGENNKETLHDFRWPVRASFLGTKKSIVGFVAEIIVLITRCWIVYSCYI